jgi:hypothetical protein
LTNRLLLPLLTMAVIAAGAGDLCAQGVLQPGEAAPNGRSGNTQGSFPVTGAAPIAGVMMAPGQGALPVNGAAAIAGVTMAPSPQAGGAQEQCTTDFQPLRDEAERRGKLIKAASDRHAPPDEACKLIASFGQAESKMIQYVQAHAAQCGIPPQIGDQLKAGHKNTEALKTKVCSVAQQVQQRGAAGPSLSEVLGTSSSAPEATASRKGGSTFDTMNGNVLAR